MSNAEMVTLIKTRQELIRMREELDAELDATNDRIKAGMGDTESATFGEYKVTYKYVTSTRVDPTKVKKALTADLVAALSTTTTTRPLRIS